MSEQPTARHIDWLFAAYLNASGDAEQANAVTQLNDALDRASVATRLAVAARLPLQLVGSIGRHARSVWREESQS